MSTCNQITLNSLTSCQILSSSYRFIGGHFTDPHCVIQLVSFLTSLPLSYALATIHHDWVNPVRQSPSRSNSQTLRQLGLPVHLSLPGIQLVRKGAKRTFTEWMWALCPACQKAQCGLSLGPGQMLLLRKRFTVCLRPPPQKRTDLCKMLAASNLEQTII